MDPFDRFDARRRRVNFEAFAAFAVGVIVAYLLQVMLRFGGGGFFTALIVIAVGGGWYHFRRIF